MFDIKVNTGVVKAGLVTSGALFGAALRVQIRGAVTRSGLSTRDQIRAKALQQGLHRAAAATGAQVTFTGRSTGVRIATDAAAAPYARPLERGSAGSGGQYNRHPVFGRGRTNQPVRPFFIQTASASGPSTELRMAAAMDAAARLAGFH